jgi:hypothetical protein
MQWKGMSRIIQDTLMFLFLALLLCHMKVYWEVELEHGSQVSHGF